MESYGCMAKEYVNGIPMEKEYVNDPIAKGIGGIHE